MKQELQNAWDHLISLWYTPHYLAVYGSQNYWLDIHTEEYQSDVDFKCIIIPTLRDLIRNSKPLSTVVNYNEWQIDIKDIRSYVESVVKCNVNFLEILNTPYYLCEDEFLRPYLRWLMEEMGQFYLKACYGMMLEKQEALRHPYPATKDKIDKFWYDPKQLHHIARLVILMRRYRDWDILNFLHTGKEAESLINTKLGMHHNRDVDSIVDFLIRDAKQIRDNYTVDPIFTTKQKLIEESYNIIYNTICQNLKS